MTPLIILNVMADAKIHDMPSIIDAGVGIVTIHCSSNFRPKNINFLKYIEGLTILISFTDFKLKWISERIAEDIVKAFSNIALKNNCGYIFCSVKDLNYFQDNLLKKI